jgi:hypothetical protein
MTKTEFLNSSTWGINPNRALLHFRELIGTGTPVSRAGDWLFYGFPRKPEWARDYGFTEAERIHLVKVLQRLDAQKRHLSAE